MSRSLGNLLTFSLLWMLAMLPVYPADMVLTLADGLAREGDYQASITEYKRYIFFNPNPHDLATVYLHLGVTYYLAELPDEGDKVFAHALELAPNDTILNQLRTEIAIHYLAYGRNVQAESLLLRVVTFAVDTDMQRRAWFFLGVAGLQSYQWSEAQSAFDQAFPDTDDATARSIHILLDPDRIPRLSSPRVAKRLSTILPGSGQIYAGDWKNGINALLLNLLGASTVITPLSQGDYKTAISSYFMVFDRFYRGNRFHAGRITEEKNNRKLAVFTQQTLEKILTIIKEKEAHDNASVKPSKTAE